MPGKRAVMRELSAVILSYREYDSYRNVLADLLAQGMPEQDVCIVHNPVTASDRAVEVAPGLTVIRMPGNMGYAGGMNAGMRHQLERKTEWIWLLTHDVRLREGALAAMLAAAREHRECGALGPLLLNAGTDVVFSLGGERTRWGLPYNAGYGTRWQDRAPPRYPTRACAWLDGSSIMLRAAALREVGLYDTAMFGYAEDAELCLRLGRAGWSVRVVENAVAEQTAGTSSRPGAVAFLLARNGLRYARAAAGRWAIAPMLARNVRESVHFLRLALTGPGRRAAMIQCCATWIGVLAFICGRTGPPPAWLPGRGDMSTAAQPPGGT
ncbi:MAG: glycosyltransferase family 2 protein [Actinomycetota bacterium]|nr:glycosyltransferase family 2 protein [Actinomycetota bacterium]